MESEKITKCFSFERRATSMAMFVVTHDALRKHGTCWLLPVSSCLGRQSYWQTSFSTC